MLKLRITAWVLVFSLLAGCANKHIANSEAINQAAAKEAGQTERTLEGVIHDATLALSEAANSGLAFYSPLHMEQAKDALEQAKKLNKPGAKSEKKEQAMVLAVSVGKLLDSGERNKEKVKSLLAKSLDHKAVLQELGTDKVLPKEYEHGMGLLDAAIREVAGGDIKKVEKRQTDVIAYFNKIEGDTLRVQWLSKAKLMMEKAKDVDADDFAEKSYEQAERAYETADDFIETSFRDREGVKAISATAYNQAAKAYYIAMEVQKVVDKKEKEVEQYMLSTQSLFDQINQDVNVNNLSSRSFADQARLLAERIRVYTAKGSK